MKKRLLKCLFFVVLVRPLVILLIGLNVYHRERLPKEGPHVIVANHNSHLDTLVLMGLMPLRLLWHTRPVAAADYFLANKWLAWFSLNVLDIIPVWRKGRAGHGHPLQGCFDALDAGNILILFPEGSRGRPEQMQPLKRGIGHLLRGYPQVGVTPVLLRGLGRALPKGEALLVPVNCDVAVGTPLYLEGDEDAFMTAIEDSFCQLAPLCTAGSGEDQSAE